SVAERAEAELAIEPAIASELRRRHELAGKFAGLSPRQRMEALQRLDADLARLLGPAVHDRYRRLAQAELEAAAMQVN
ncbi:MAG: hypothetical protein ABW217_16745, partial [Polyangiaceae bacterium]